MVEGLVFLGFMVLHLGLGVGLRIQSGLRVRIIPYLAVHGQL